MTADIAVVVTVHEEGRLAHATFASIARAVTRFAAAGGVAEVAVVEARADAATRLYLDEHCPRDWVRTVCDGDLSAARNLGIAATRAPVVALIDGDDLWSADWLVQVRAAVLTAPGDVHHPEVTIFFGAYYGVTLLQPFEQALSDAFALLEATPFPSTAVAARAVFEACPFKSLGDEEGFGYRDRHWHCETVASGIAHRPVPGSFYFRRAKTGEESLSQREQKVGQRLPASRLFDWPGP